MLPDKLGAYRIIAELGRGGMGVVYEAITPSGDRVALKTLTASDAHHARALRREIRTLAQLSHEGVVQICDHGLEMGAPWYAMAFLEGPPMSAVMAQLHREPTGPGALRRIARLFVRLCEPLAYMHGEGLVHRDLKPDNVIVLEEDRPVLVDFGLMSRFDAVDSRDRIEVMGGAAGTVAYMAPEQIRGEWVDARADLYALGCLLFECVSGRPLFAEVEPRALLHAHLHRAPPRLSACAPGVPPELDALVARLLLKDPRARLGYAGLVAEALRPLAGDHHEARPTQAYTYLYRPSYAGRREVSGALRGYLDARFQDGRGGWVFMGGESGVGKTRFGLELTRALVGVRCIVSASPESAVPGASLRPIVQAMVDRACAVGSEEVQRIFGSMARVLLPWAPAVARLPGFDAQPEPAELSAREGRLRLLCVLTDALVAFAQEEPVLVVFDDLQWADALTLDWLHVVMRSQALERIPCVVLGLHRTEERSTGLDRLLGDPRARCLSLARLEQGAIGEIVAGMLAVERVPPGLLDYVCQASEGNPLFAAEYLRWAVEQGVLARDVRGAWQITDGGLEPDTLADALPLPDSLRALILRRIERFDASAVQALSRAAVLGRAVNVEVWRAAQDDETDGVDLDALIHSCVRRHLFHREPRSTQLSFAHDKIREVLLARLSSSELRAAHRAAAEAIEGTTCEGGDDANTLKTRSVRLARHWEAAAEPERAAQHFLAAADHALAQSAVVEAERLYLGYLRTSPSTPCDERIRVHQALSVDVYSILGDFDAAERHFSSGLEDATALESDAWHVRLSVGQVAVEVRSGHVAEAAERARAILQRAEVLHDEPQSAVELYTRLGELGMLLGEPQQGLAALEHAQELVRNHPELRSHTTTVYCVLGLLLREQHEYAAAREALHVALEHSDGPSNVRQRAFTLNTLAGVELYMGRLEEARHLYEEALSITRRIGDRRFSAIVSHDLSETCLTEGRYERAHIIALQGLETIRAFGDQRFTAALHACVAAAAIELERHEEALAHLRCCEAILESAWDSLNASQAYLLLARVMRRMRRWDEARAWLEKADALNDRCGLTRGMLLGLCERGLMRLELDQPVRELLLEARERLQDEDVQSSSLVAQRVAELERAVVARTSL